MAKARARHRRPGHGDLPSTVDWGPVQRVSGAESAAPSPSGRPRAWPPRPGSPGLSRWTDAPWPGTVPTD